MSEDIDFLEQQDRARTVEAVRFEGVFEDRHAEELAALVAKAKAGGDRALSLEQAYQHDKLLAARHVAQFISDTERGKGMTPRLVAEIAFARAAALFCVEADARRQRNRFLEDRIATLEAAIKPRHRAKASSRAVP